MNKVLQLAWADVLGPLLQRPKQLQVAALCHRGEAENREYLLVTSRSSKRWIIPKGWPMRGLKSNEAALQEAWEEAGVKKGCASSEPQGTYTYQKRKRSGWSFPVETLVYSVAVSEMADKYPEAKERTRKWVSPEAAAKLVDEPELKAIFLSRTG
jgi:8-oxo-dGTP pyrophosphatase MutT (NUDIX family)